MAKKNFKKGLNLLIEENIDDINEVTSKKVDDANLIDKIDIENITDKKLKWMLIKIQRLEKELLLWRTGKLNIDNFMKSLKEHGLEYDKKNNKFKEI